MWIMLATAAGEPPMQLTLYVRRDCHLCAEMHRELLEAGAGGASGARPDVRFEVELVDIDAHPSLAARYGHKVPVLVGAGEEICHYFLDQQQLDAFLSRTT